MIDLESVLRGLAKDSLIRRGRWNITDNDIDEEVAEMLRWLSESYKHPNAQELDARIDICAQNIDEVRKP
jgi:alkylhydroperoxidase family enzyme